MALCTEDECRLKLPRMIEEARNMVDFYIWDDRPAKAKVQSSFSRPEIHVAVFLATYNPAEHNLIGQIQGKAQYVFNAMGAYGQLAKFSSMHEVVMTLQVVPAEAHLGNSEQACNPEDNWVFQQCSTPDVADVAGVRIH